MFLNDKDMTQRPNYRMNLNGFTYFFRLFSTSTHSIIVLSTVKCKTSGAELNLSIPPSCNHLWSLEVHKNIFVILFPMFPFVDSSLVFFLFLTFYFCLFFLSYMDFTFIYHHTFIFFFIYHNLMGLLIFICQDFQFDIIIIAKTWFCNLKIEDQ